MGFEAAACCAARSKVVWLHWVQIIRPAFAALPKPTVMIRVFTQVEHLSSPERDTFTVLLWASQAADPQLRATTSLICPIAGCDGSKPNPILYTIKQQSSISKMARWTSSIKRSIKNNRSVFWCFHSDRVQAQSGWSCLLMSLMPIVIIIIIFITQSVRKTNTPNSHIWTSICCIKAAEPVRKRLLHCETAAGLK